MSAFIVDTETTGMEQPEPVEIAWLAIGLSGDDLGGLEVLAEFSARYRPSKPIELGALATHHIMDEDLLECPPSSEVSPPAGMDYMIGHNVDFDWEVLGKPEVRRIDTCCLARKLWPAADSHSLAAMIYLLRRSDARELLQDSHSALADAKNCARLLVHILAKLGEPLTWEQLWQHSEIARVPEIMPFGKHKGMRIADVPRDYKQWLLRQPDVDVYLQQALRGS